MDIGLNRVPMTWFIEFYASDCLNFKKSGNWLYFGINALKIPKEHAAFEIALMRCYLPLLISLQCMCMVHRQTTYMYIQLPASKWPLHEKKNCLRATGGYFSQFPRLPSSSPKAKPLGTDIRIYLTSYHTFHPELNQVSERDRGTVIG